MTRAQFQHLLGDPLTQIVGRPADRTFWNPQTGFFRDPSDRRLDPTEAIVAHFLREAKAERDHEKEEA